ncbi:DIS3-like exonuclease 2 [Athalia rosae]|uniref:DIS3-like exonuclease 2 n=1 Tax=Athalia rosae TaxID=37344 RepID=UPI0020336593|nr:DIS3-like exonuclease 2 [Athalia rosae]XP_048507220.1 DIS3-like exonuclease 2 [Athalia rosae]
MNEKNGQEPKASAATSGPKKIRRGKRGNKKPDLHPLEQFLLSAAMAKLEVAPKKRQLRRPKVPEQRVPVTIERHNISNVAAASLTPSAVQSKATLSQTQMNKTKPDQGTEKNSVYFSDNSNQRLEANLVVQASMSTRKQKTNSRKEKNEICNITENTNIKGEKKKKTHTKTQTSGIDQKNPENNKFPDYIAKKTARSLLAAQKPSEIEYVEGNIRINPKFFKEAYVPMLNDEVDLLIHGLLDRNRALEGDLVVVKINPMEKWHGLQTSRVQKTATVVCILEKIHPRKIVGFLKPMADRNTQIALFAPKDHKVPRLNIDRSSWPPNFDKDPNSFSNTMFLAEIVSWNDVRFARGKILSGIGEVGDLKAESLAILLENDLDVTPYAPELIKDVPPSNYQPTLTDIDGREDWRQKCIFTIDPATAQDLDDAMSCKLLENGNYEVGVHISDVTHFLSAFSPLDKAVAKRATTIYLSDSVYHMLPKQLCNVCSLLPGLDKLAFSVIFEMTPDAEVVKHRFTKTVINSCCQLAYEDAQMMIMNPEKEWSPEEFPEIKGPYKVSELCIIVNNLNNLAVKMRERRLKEGSLRIDQMKLQVIVDRESGLPVSFTVEKREDSNKLIEEFMLLANITTANHIYKNFPDVALLRCHRPPLMRSLSETQTMLAKLGIHIDIESAGALQASLLHYEADLNGAFNRESYLASVRSMVLYALCAKTMTRAKYFCTSSKMSESDSRHYALNVPLYTHFTSPIRRYPDCVVHRLLHASIQNEAIPHWTQKLCSSIAANCNKQKLNAKRAQEMSNNFYLTYLLGLTGPVDSTAIAIDVKDRSVDVVICNMGITLRIYCAKIEKHATVHHAKDDDVQTLTIIWKKSNVTQVINIFSIMNVRVCKNPTTKCLEGELLPP